MVGLTEETAQLEALLDKAVAANMDRFIAAAIAALPMDGNPLTELIRASLLTFLSLIGQRRLGRGILIVGPERN